MWDLDYKESWVQKNWCFWTVVLEKTLESPLDSKEIKPVHLKGDQSWIFIERTDVVAETPILWPFDAKNWLICKDPDAGKDWKQEEKGTTKDEMIGWPSQAQWTWVWANSGSWQWTGRPDLFRSIGSQSRTQLSDWTELTWPDICHQKLTISVFAHNFLSFRFSVSVTVCLFFLHSCSRSLPLLLFPIFQPLSGFTFFPIQHRLNSPSFHSPLCSPSYNAAAAAKLLQSCPTLCNPIDGSPPGSPIPGILQARTLVGCHFLLQCMKVKSESEIAQLCPTLSNPMDCSLPGSSIHGIFRKEYWSGVPLPIVKKKKWSRSVVSNS